MSKTHKWDVTDTRHPGVYEIYDLKNKKSYYGETDCLCDRYARHIRALRKGVHHDNTGLLKAFQEQNKKFEGFRFFVLEYGPEYSDRDKRVKCQDEYIALNSESCYNVTEISFDTACYTRNV